HEAAQLQAQRDREMHEKLMEIQRKNQEKQTALHEQMLEQQQVSFRNPRMVYNFDCMLKESAAANLILVQENHERQRLILKEAEDKRLESERIARENEIRLREENEQKRDKEREDARNREDR
ncbi:hypothetical protein PENTCL1PPCAC_219, partial [Pristionchus entomophagus]